MELLFAFSFGEVAIIGTLAVLLFGKNLPQMGKKVGKYYAEFKRGYQNVQNEVRSVMSEIQDLSDSPKGGTRNTSRPMIAPGTVAKNEKVERDADHVESVAPRFEPPKDG